MRSLKDFNLENDIKSFYSNYWNTHDFNNWLNETYEDRCLIENISESDFYNDKYIYENYTHDIPHYNIYTSLIYERLGKSFILTNKNIDTIKNIKGIINIKLINNKKQKFEIIVNDQFDQSSFTTLMNFYNYALDIKSKSKDSNGNYHLLYEAVIPEEINYTNKFVYHVTHKSAWDKIQKYGLTPKQKSNHSRDFIDNDKQGIEYPARIYFFSSSTNKDTIIRFARLNNIIHNRKANDIILLKIDLSKLDYKIKIFGDPAFNISQALFTMEPIPTKCISETDKIINEQQGKPIDDNWINSEKPVMTIDGRSVIIMDIDRRQIPNIIIGKIKFGNRLLDYTWNDQGQCITAQDQYGNPRKAEKNDNLVKAK